MNCESARVLLEKYIDNELPLSDKREFETHLNVCSTCQSSISQLTALSRGVHSMPYQKAPNQLKKAIRHDLRSLSNEDEVAGSPFQWLAFAGGLMVLLATLIFVSTQFAFNEPGTPDSTRFIVDAHVRSLQLDHLLDIKHSDSHVVKPWFSGKVDFAPTVRNLQNQGYPLLGARMEYVNGKSGGVLVYKRRKHIINVFLFSTQNNGRRDGKPKNREKNFKGFNILREIAGGLEIWIVSDLNLPELRKFRALITQ